MAAVAAEPDAKAMPCGAALERRDRPFEPLAGRVLRARVLVTAARASDAVLGVGRGLVDRRRDGPGQLVGLGAGMDGQRVEAGLAARRRASSSASAPRHHGTRAVTSRRPAIELEHELLAVDVVDLDAGLPEAEPATIASERRCPVRPTPGTGRRPGRAPSRTAPARPPTPRPGGGTPARPGSRPRPGRPLGRGVEPARADRPGACRPPRSGRSPGRATAGRPDRATGRRSGTGGSGRGCRAGPRDDRADLGLGRRPGRARRGIP